MAPSQLPAIFNATSQDIEMLISAQAHLGSKNLQVHMEPYLWKTRPDGINVINIGKTWYEHFWNLVSFWRKKRCILTFFL
jgi:small subunit ribosomal protein SAe